jgi:hypothetical protein
MDFAHEYRLRHSVGSTIPSDVAIVAGNGWFHIIQNAANKLAALGLRNLVSISITRVVAVDGGLIIDTNVDEVAASRAIRNAAASICAQADDEAHGQCEICGGPWRSVKAGMTWRTRCDVCEVS